MTPQLLKALILFIDARADYATNRNPETMHNVTECLKELIRAAGFAQFFSDMF